MIDKSIVNDMAMILTGQSEKVVGEALSLPAVATVQGNLDLMIDGFGKPIPAEDYHKIKGVSVAPGDRVLAVPIEDGHTFIVTGGVE
ncbi:hypothetical protein [Sporosarcina newyorkensis]|uniref:hypothetical protein n=1 Tax=Sporosarcina newyorkensis TaxID=759851 RepID=UPI0003110077|nr:hypothetical protein [Sporosarcina newyorkensis]